MGCFLCCPMCSRFLARLIALAALALPLRSPAADFDVVIYGGTPGGICAAVAASRAGAHTLLLEPSAHIGGLMSGGLSFSDSNQTDRRTLGSLFHEIHGRIAADYQRRGVALPYDVKVMDNSKWTYEPHVAVQVFDDMLAQAGVKVLTGQVLTSVEKEGAHVRRVVTDDETHTAKVFVDATYEGDLVAAAKISYALGREGKAQYGESLAGQQYPKPAMKFSPRDEAGRLLPLLTGEEAGADRGDHRVMTYSWRLCMTTDPALAVPLQQPKTYDPARFELARRLFANSKDTNVCGLDLYPLPGGKVDVNNGINRQISMGLLGPQSAWCDASPTERHKIWLAHRDYTLELLWFLGHDPAVPEKVRNTIAPLGFAKDEFTDSEYWPPALYVREGRRTLGETVMTQADILHDVTKPDAIGISSFPIDSHDCQRVATPDGGWINEGTIFPVHMKGTKYGQPHQVPYRAITPRRAECDNLLAPVPISASHVAYSSIRVEPTWMTIGQSAGIAAALAARENLPVQDVPIAKLQTELRAAGQPLDLLPEHLAAAKESAR